MEALEKRIVALEERFKKLEADLGLSEVQGLPAGRREGIQQSGDRSSETELALIEELKGSRFSFARFVRVPSDYYDKDLEYRRLCLGALSCGQLCKTMVMVNTKWVDVDSEMNVQYLMVIVQYEKDRVHGEKLRSFMHRLNEGKVGRKNFNWRLAPEEVSAKMTGFGHNAITPIATSTRMPIVISDEIVELEEGTFYLGAGEVDLKVELKTEEFVQKYKVRVIDCTY